VSPSSNEHATDVSDNYRVVNSSPALHLKKRQQVENPAHGQANSNNSSYFVVNSGHFTDTEDEDDNGEDDDNAEFEVEQIQDVRRSRGRLQYRVKWKGFKSDPRWYDYLNFENSPYSLQEFHDANPSKYKPPRLLKVWLKRCEEDEDDDEPTRSPERRSSY
jgi:hypothetical protein